MSERRQAIGIWEDERYSSYEGAERDLRKVLVTLRDHSFLAASLQREVSEREQKLTKVTEAIAVLHSIRDNIAAQLVTHTPMDEQ